MLEVTKGKLCYIVGTVYMDMPLKPNVLEDLARDVSIHGVGRIRTFRADFFVCSIEHNTPTTTRPKILLK